MSDVPAAPAAAESINVPAAAAVPQAVSPAPEIAVAVAPEAPAATAEAAPAIDAQSRAPSLLSADAPQTESAAEAPQAAEAGEKPAEPAALAKPEKPAEPSPPEPLVYEKFAVPEGVALDDERVAPFLEIVAPLQVPQHEAQRLVDLHIAEMQRHNEHLQREQHRVFAETRRDWVAAFEADPELGGNRRDTTLANALWAINEFGGDADQVRELKNMLSMTGGGDHLALIRLMNNVALRSRERGAPPPALPPKQGGGGRPEERRYTNM